MTKRQLNKMRLKNGLFFTDEDIYILYRDSKHKKQSVKILTQMNLCTVDEIKDALIRGGADPDQLNKVIK